ncbi:MAG TPA: hypothetical protein VF812_17045 [Ktedonobacterales bacterium]
MRESDGNKMTQWGWPTTTGDAIWLVVDLGIMLTFFSLLVWMLVSAAKARTDLGEDEAEDVDADRAVDSALAALGTPRYEPTPARVYAPERPHADEETIERMRQWLAELRVAVPSDTAR